MNLKTISLTLGLALSGALLGQSALAGTYQPYWDYQERQRYQGYQHNQDYRRYDSRRHSDFDDRHRYDHRDSDHRKDHRKRVGRVVDVKPLWRDKGRHDRYDCRDRRDYSGVDSGTRDRARIAGAIAGAAVGNLVGRDHDNATFSTVAGALIGAAGGDLIVSHRDDRRGKDCVKHDKLKYHHQPVAYLVRYEYRNRIYTTKTRKHPGRYIRIDSGYRKGG
ncbi:glycine zipper 2TM domain-containing protein [Marinobacterium sp. YM272]|uniref:glycine zipper 2TM domain-containing protein n=1 Tax=Marinobacterium sp. YM272 TaxID=3421654 RepID=UPI003D7F4754